MFSFGWSEIALTIVIIVIVVGPKEIPNLLRQLGSFSKSIKKISREFKSSLNEITDDNEIKAVKDTLSDLKDINNDLNPTKKSNNSTDKNTTSDIFNKEIKNLNKTDNKQVK